MKVEISSIPLITRRYGKYFELRKEARKLQDNQALKITDVTYEEMNIIRASLTGEFKTRIYDSALYIIPKGKNNES